MKRIALTPKRKRLVTGLMIALGISGVMCASFYFNLFNSMQLRSGDLLFQAASAFQNNQGDDKIIIVGIDDKSLAELGHFQSWPRTDYALVVDNLARAGARVIVFDVMFSEPTGSDAELADSIARAGNVVMPVAADDATMSGTASLLKPLPSFVKETSALGHADISQDTDGLVRSLSAVLRDNGTEEPALSLAAVAEYLRRPSVLESGIENGNLSFNGRNIPIVNGNQILINYQHASDAETSFPQVSFVDVLNSQADSSIFKDKIVLIGATGTGLGDTFWTPVGRMNGVEIHANAINMILKASFLKPVSATATVAMMLVLALLCAYVSLRWKLAAALTASAFMLMACFLAAFLLFDWGIQLNFFYLSLTVLASMLGINIYNVAAERAQRGELGKTFGRYVSPSVAEKIINSLEQGGLHLGGREQDVTVMFADVRGYTGLSQKIEPSTLVKLLNVYLSAIIQSVIKYEGMVNKFAGDNIMAVWNAPTECAAHPLMAVKAALAAQQAVAAVWEQQPGLPRMEFGIGINTGKVVAGNMGSEDRLEYSVIGETVNFASRITAAAPANKIWIGEATYAKIKAGVNAKRLENLAVKGGVLPFPVYEVTAVSDSAASLEGCEAGKPRKENAIEPDFRTEIAGAQI